MMAARKYLCLILLLTAGCTTTMAENVRSVSDSYEAVVFDDGISLEESKTIAQKQLIKKNVVDIYDLTKPQATDDVSELPDHEDYWFIYFQEKKPSNIPFIFMTVINRQTGKIKFAEDYNEGNQWILEAALLR